MLLEILKYSLLNQMNQIADHGTTRLWTVLKQHNYKIKRPKCTREQDRTRQAREGKDKTEYTSRMSWYLILGVCMKDMPISLSAVGLTGRSLS